MKLGWQASLKCTLSATFQFPCYTQENLCIWFKFLGTSELSFEPSKIQLFFDSRKDFFAEGMVGIVLLSVGRYM